jgi:3-hydroxybutyryl-CoA dehydrogenase
LTRPAGNPGRQIKQIAIIGAGTMGRGIAQVAAQYGYYPTVLCDVSREQLTNALSAIAHNMERDVERGKLKTNERDVYLSFIRGATHLEAACDADLYIEAVPERLELKHEVLRAVEAVAARPFFFATNTSSLSITEIASVSRQPERVIGMHFFNPVHKMRLLELVTGQQTSAETLAAAHDVGLWLRKEVIVVRDVPGFASSRLGVALGLEAMRMLEQGVASAKDIDTAMELGYNHPMGPLRLTDLVGLDVRLSIAEYLHGALGSETFRPPEILRRMVAAGKLGKKSGEGFYKWNEEGAPERGQ